MPKEIILIIAVISVGIIFSPIYFQRQKLWRLADDDLKQVNYEEWKIQLKRNAYIRFGSRIIWGLFLLSGFLINFQTIIVSHFNWVTIFVFVLGISFIVWGILAFRTEIRKLSKLE